MNKHILVGNLGKDPEVKYAAGGMCIAEFSLATSYSKKDASGNWGKATDWHNIKLFGKNAENAAKYLSKGDTVSIIGPVRTESWEKDGKKHYKTYTIGQEVEYVKTGNTDISSPREDDLGF